MIKSNAFNIKCLCVAHISTLCCSRTVKYLRHGEPWYISNIEKKDSIDWRFLACNFPIVKKKPKKYHFFQVLFWVLHLQHFLFHLQHCPTSQHFSFSLAYIYVVNNKKDHLHDFCLLSVSAVQCMYNYSQKWGTQNINVCCACTVYEFVVHVHSLSLVYMYIL